MIKKTSRGFEVISHKAHRCMGIYPTKAKAEARLKQIEETKRKFLAMVKRK